MFYRIRDQLNRRWHRIVCRSILRTSPLEARSGSCTVVSMLCHADVHMYLIAIKSFCRELRTAQVVVLSDGSLTTKDQEVLKHHLSGITILDVRDIDTGGCPAGNCWERLLLIADLVKHSYVVQIDADTLTLGPIPEVLSAIEAHPSYTLGTNNWPQIVSMQEASARMRAATVQHVQVLAEQHLFRLSRCCELKYVRGCAAFAGFARGSFTRADVTSFSREMYEMLGSKWNDWGSEQVTSNYTIANSLDACVLPYPRYANYEPHADISGAAFIHFYGTHRFKNNVYLNKSREAIPKLLNHAINKAIQGA